MTATVGQKNIGRKLTHVQPVPTPVKYGQPAIRNYLVNIARANTSSPPFCLSCLASYHKVVPIARSSVLYLPSSLFRLSSTGGLAVATRTCTHHMYIMRCMCDSACSAYAE